MALNIPGLRSFLAQTLADVKIDARAGLNGARRITTDGVEEVVVGIDRLEALLDEAYSKAYETRDKQQSGDSSA